MSAFFVSKKVSKRHDRHYWADMLATCRPTREGEGVPAAGRCPVATARARVTATAGAKATARGTVRVRVRSRAVARARAGARVTASRQQAAAVKYCCCYCCYSAAAAPLLSCRCHTHPATATKQQQLQGGCGSGTRAAGQRNSRVGVAGVGGGWWIFVCYGTIRCWQSPTQKPDMHVDQKSETFRHVTDMSATFPAKLTKAFTLHIQYAMCKFHDHSFPTPPPSDPDPPYFGQKVGF
jgi:hypothetical protein